MTTTAPAMDAAKIASEAYEATKDFPCFDKADRFKAMLEHLLENGSNTLDDDTQAAVIRACRAKACLA